MGVLQLFVFCAIVLVSLCEVTTNQWTKPTTILKDTRFKRETEADHLRDNRILPKKMPFGAFGKSTKIRPLVPITKPLNVHADNILPRRLFIPVSHYKPIAPSNITEVKTHEPIDGTDQHIDSKVNNDSELNGIIKPTEKNETIDPTEKYENKYESIENPPGIFTKEEIINETTNIVEEKTENITRKKNKRPALKKVKENLSPSLHAKHKKLSNKPAEPIPPSETSFELLANKTDIIPKDSIENINQLMENKNNTDLENILTDSLKYAETGAKTSLGSNPLTTLFGSSKIKVPKINKFQTHFIRPKIKILEKSDDPQTIFEDENNKVKTEPDVPIALNTLKIEPDEEILIQNNNYEELYESSASPQYLSPKLITSEFRPAQNWNNFRPMPSSPDEKYKESRNYHELNQPYSYDIKKYPNQYVVNTYDELKNRNNNYYNTPGTTYNNQWNQGYNSYFQPQSLYFGQQSNLNKYDQGQGYPKDKFWRSWRNNQILIRPRSPNALNHNELYKTINGYLANVRNNPVYNNYSAAKVTDSSGYGNQNTSPYSSNNPIQFSKRYGY